MIQVGAVSWGYGCAREDYGLYYSAFQADVTKIIHWINENTSEQEGT